MAKHGPDLPTKGAGEVECFSRRCRHWLGWLKRPGNKKFWKRKFWRRSRATARDELLDRLKSQPAQDIGPWTRDELYD